MSLKKNKKHLSRTFLILFVMLISLPRLTIAEIEEINYDDTIDDINTFDINNQLLNTQETSFNHIDIEKINVIIYESESDIRITIDGYFDDRIELMDLKNKPIRFNFIKKENFDFKIGDDPLKMNVDFQLTLNDEGMNATVDKDNIFDYVIYGNTIFIHFKTNKPPLNSNSYLITHQIWGEDDIAYIMDFYPNNIVQGLSLQQIIIIFVFIIPFASFFTVLLIFTLITRKTFSKKLRSKKPKLTRDRTK